MNLSQRLHMCQRHDMRLKTLRELMLGHETTPMKVRSAFVRCRTASKPHFKVHADRVGAKVADWKPKRLPKDKLTLLKQLDIMRDDF
eukprot:6468536-Amphidinium_carterae.1